MHAYADIKRLVSILASKRDRYNHHGSRTALYALKLAMVLQISPPEAALIETGAHLHDIGKLLIPMALLNAPRALNAEERAEVETHVQRGWEVVSEAGYDQVVLNAVRLHHERWDGAGYPDRLTGREIPIEAQIVGICDCYDAMTSQRTYREAFSHPFTMAFMQKDKRTKFNPELIDLFFAKVVVK